MASRVQMSTVLFVVALAAAAEAYMLSSPIVTARTSSAISRRSIPVLSRGSGLKLRMSADEAAAPAETASEPATGGTFEFWTRPRTTNANWGCFFEVATKDSPVWITGLRAGGHSFASADEYTRLDLKVFTKEGTCVGFEKDEAAWNEIGKAEQMKLPRIEVGDSFATFTPLPIDEPIEIPANSVQGFCIHTNMKTGIALRRKVNFDSNSYGDPFFKDWVDGVTDEGDHFKLIAGLCPGEKVFEDVSDSTNARAFVGVVDYSLSAP